MDQKPRDRPLTQGELIRNAQRECKTRKALRDAMDQFGFSKRQQGAVTKLTIERRNLFCSLLRTDRKKGIQVIEFLSRNALWFVRSDLAAFFQESNETGVKWFLATDRSSCVRASLAANHSVPVDILERLADDPEESVRYAVASNPNTSHGTLASFIANDYESVHIQRRARNVMRTKS
jgi:hypothetical protein